MSAWDKYLQGFLMNKQLPGGKWLQKCVEHAAIMTSEGTLLSATPGFNLGHYVFEMQIDEKTTKNVVVDERVGIKQVVNTGKADGLEAGVRINGLKYVLVNYDASKKLAYFSKKEGGACIMVTKTTIIFASYSVTQKMSDGVAQNAGICNEVVEKLATTLIANKC
jgi:hypothetical protein